MARLSFFNEEDLDNATVSKEKLITISQGRSSLLTLYPSKKDIGVRYIPYILKDIHVNYGVRIIQNHNSENQQLDFETSIGIVKHEDTYCYKISRHQVYINNSLPSTTIEEIASLCGGVLYPILIEHSDFKIQNITEIKDRWLQLKKVLLDKFQGDFVEDYIVSMDEVLKNDMAINRALEQDMFLAMLKHTIDTRSYDETLKSEVIFNFPIIPFSSSIRYKGKQIVKKYYTPYNTIRTELEGEIIENRSVKDLKSKKRFPISENSKGTKPEGTCNVAYDLDRKTGILKFCKSTIMIDLDGDISSTTIIINELQS